MTGSDASGRGRRVMISCGEASGDLYAAALVEAMRAIDPGVDVIGFGGDRLRQAGARLVGDYRGISVTGLTEALKVVRQSWRLLKQLGKHKTGKGCLYIKKLADVDVALLTKLMQDSVQELRDRLRESK